jgi:hypothetical protein
VNFYLTTVSSPDLAATGANCIGEAAPQFGSTVASASSTFTGATTQSTSSAVTVGGAGWVPVNFASTSGGSPLSALPNDPLNPDTTTYNYQYACNQSATTFELNANMESTRYASSGTDDVESTDGGNVVGIYEVGNDPGLDL